jgi:hypothetical protein
MPRPRDNVAALARNEWWRLVRLEGEFREAEVVQSEELVGHGDVDGLIVGELSGAEGDASSADVVDGDDQVAAAKGIQALRHHNLGADGGEGRGKPPPRLQADDRLRQAPNSGFARGGSVLPGRTRLTGRRGRQVYLADAVSERIVIKDEVEALLALHRPTGAVTPAAPPLCHSNVI